MNRTTLNEAIFEAERFLKAAKAVDNAELGKSYTYGKSVPVAAAKRASMDLTRALARMRRPS